MAEPAWVQDAVAIEKSIRNAMADIEELKTKLKDAKDLRDKLVAELCDTVRRQNEPTFADVEKQ